MGFFDRFIKKQINSSLFAFLLGTQAPDMKGRDYLNAYKGWVYACVNAIAEEVASIDLRLIRKTKDGRQEIDNHLALNLLHDVNPFTSSSELLLGTQAYLELDGNAFWYLPKGAITKKPAEMWLLDPTRVYVVKSAEKFIGGYVYKNEKGQDVPLLVDEILHFKRFNPLNKYRGLGTVQAAALAVDVDTFSGQWNKNFFFNAAVPSAVLETEGSISEEQYQRLKANWDVSHRGLENAHKLAILQGGLKFKPMNLSQKDMEFLEQRRFSRDEILGIFRVPKTILGITEDVNRVNAEASEFVFAKRVIKPRMQFITDRLNEFFLPLFREDTTKLEFVFTDPVPQNIELDLKKKETGLSAGYLTVNEVREEEGRPPVTNGDTIFISSLLLPLGQVQDQKAKAMTKVHDPRTQEIIAKRIQFLVSEIKRRKPRYKAIFDEAKDQLTNKLNAFGNKSVRKAKVDDIARAAFEDYEKILVSFTDEVRDTLETSLTRAGKTALARVGVEIAFDLEHPRAVEFLTRHALEEATGISNRLKEEMRARIVSGVDEGLGPVDIAQDLRKFFDEQSDFRAERIARTEVVAGYQQGNMEGYRQSGVVISKKWLTAGDDRVDDDCLQNEADGEIPLDAGFSSGDDTPPVHPNCRCDLVPIAGDGEKTALYEQVKAKVDRHIEEKTKEAIENIKKSEASARAESEKVIAKAKQTGLSIVDEAKSQAQKEKTKIVKELKELKDKALEIVYEKEE